MKGSCSAIANPYGMVLVTGPTGSGRPQRSIGALAREHARGQRDDRRGPGRDNLDGINQVLVHEDIGLTFSAALKAFLRQDPNIIMVGEIRDLDTGFDRRQGGAHGHWCCPPCTPTTRPARSAHDLTWRRALPGGVVGENLSPRPAPGAPECAAAAGPADAPARRCCTSCSSRRAGRRRHVLEGRGCVDCKQHRLPRTPGRLRGDADVPGDPRAGAGAGVGHEIKKLAISQGMLTCGGNALEKLKRGLTTVESAQETAADQF